MPTAAARRGKVPVCVYLNEKAGRPATENTLGRTTAYETYSP